MNDTGLMEKAIENKMDITYVATADYSCNICRKFVRKGKSHAHPSLKLFKSKTKGNYR